MLPSILDAAIQHGLEMNERSAKNLKDVRFKCPFCGADKGKDNKYYLSVNTKDNVFRCWYCNESGGVLRFMALLENVSIEELKRRLFSGHKSSRRGKKLHPAEKLTPVQLRELGFDRINWSALKKNYSLYKRTLNWVWCNWEEYVRINKRWAYIEFLAAETGERKLAVCRKYAAKLNLSAGELLREFVEARYKEPAWAVSAEKFLSALNMPVSPDPIAAGRERKE